MTINNPNIELVISVLNGINIDGESMQYIIEKVGMTDQMKSQLGVTTEMPEHVINQIAEDISIDLDNEGLDLIVDQEFEINANEIYLKDVYNRYSREKVIKDVLEGYFKSIE